ncbi:peptidase S8/S53 subtilisin kexin sedolisin [Actinomadura verrucosospora]|uniref:Peptidase S8/S53 subtilisin kexin sedolisin n=2 Tax=Actinomadura verrucosospora TaxID=46165 RepID=A0A7D3VRH1_ACTVE|nr:peptidase S8/S53 subtilisin kexin sedolisin [Actinomadura verrucosospora]
MGAIDSHGTYYPNSRGTSNAAALTSAAAALVRSRNPDMTGRTVVQRLIATAMPIGKKAWNPQIGYGVILIRGAMDPVKYPLKPGTPNPVYEAFDRWKASTYPARSQPMTTAARKKTTHSGGTGTSTIVAGAAAAVLVIGGLVAGVLVVSRRRGLDRTSHS